MGPENSGGENEGVLGEEGIRRSEMAGGGGAGQPPGNVLAGDGNAGDAEEETRN